MRRLRVPHRRDKRNSRQQHRRKPPCETPPRGSPDYCLATVNVPLAATVQFTAAYIPLIDIAPLSLLAVFAKEVDHIPDTELLSDRTSVNTIVPLPDWLLRIVPDHLPTMSVAVGAVETNPHATTPHATKAAVPTIFNSRRMSAPGRVRRPTSYAETSVCRTVR